MRIIGTINTGDIGARSVIIGNNEIAVLLTPAELMFLQSAIINTPSLSDNVDSFCTILNGHICNTIDIEHNSDKGEL